MQWHTQDRNIITNLKVQGGFTLPVISATDVVMWDCHGDEYAKGRYDMILGQDLLSELVLNLKLSEQVIKADNGTFKGSTTPMVDLVTYILKI